MRPDYDGVVYYSDYDGSLGIEFEKAKNLADSFDEDKAYSDINEILELYNVYRIMKSPGIKGEFTLPYETKTKRMMASIATYFSNITDENIMDIYLRISYIYVDDFWSLIEKFKVYERISNTVFQDILNNKETTLYIILKQKNIVKHYDAVLADFMRQSDQSARILIGKFLERKDNDTDNIEIPSSLLPNEFEPIFQKYIESEQPNIGVLQLIASSQSSVECPISDRLRLMAQQKATFLIDNKQIYISDISFGVGIRFQKNKDIKTYEQTGPFGFQITYDISWLNDNLDYPTLLNNFIYLFEYTDLCFRCQFVSIKSQLGILESTMGIKGKKEYEIGVAFHMEDMKSSAEMNIYSKLLSDYNIQIEDLIRWFFSDYLKEEFNVDGFIVNMPSSNSSSLEKCRHLLSEMDGILKQYSLYARYHTIDRLLLEMSSNHVVFSDLPSMTENKYAYAQSDDLKKELFLLFSDQSLLNYDHKRKISERSFFDLARKLKMYFSDYPKWAHNNLKWLEERGTIKIENDGLIKFNVTRLLLLKDLFDQEVICTSYSNKEIVNQLVTAGDLRYGSTLFSEPEQKYLNYMLNKSQFSNGLDLRNKYIHGSNTLDEQQQQLDYIIILKLMIITIIKINEEFCLTKPVVLISESEEQGSET